MCSDETCSESSQDSDVDDSEFPGCREGRLITLLSFCERAVLGPKVIAIRMMDVFCQSSGRVY